MAATRRIVTSGVCTALLNASAGAGSGTTEYQYGLGHDGFYAPQASIKEACKLQDEPASASRTDSSQVEHLLYVYTEYQVPLRVTYLLTHVHRIRPSINGLRTGSVNSPQAHTA